MNLIALLLRQRPIWQTLFVILLSLSAVSLWSQAPQQTMDDWILLENPVLFPGTGAGKVRAIFELAYREEGMSKIEVTVVLLVGQPGVAASRTQLDNTFPYQMTTNKAERLAEHYFDVEYLVSTTSPGLKAQFRVSGSYYFNGEKRSVDYLGPLMDVPGNGNTGTLIVNSKIWDPTAVGEYRLPTAEEIAGETGVELNRAVVSKMDANGRTSIPLAPGRYEFYAFAEGRRSNPSVVRVEKDKVVSVEATLDEGKEFWNPLVVDMPLWLPTAEGIFSADSSAFLLRFRSFGKLFDVGKPGNLTVSYQDANGNQSESVQDLFIRGPFTGHIISNGTNGLALKNILAKAKGAPITFSGDVSGQSFAYEMRMGTRKIQGKLKPPPSRLSLSVANQTVAVWLVGQQVTLVATTDANGNFQLPVLVPEGVVANLLVTVVGSDGMNFHGDATFSTLKDQNVTVTLRGPDDLLNNVQPFQLASSATSDSIDQMASNDGVVPPSTGSRYVSQAKEKRPATYTQDLVFGNSWGLVSEPQAPLIGLLPLPQGTKKLTIDFEIDSGRQVAMSAFGKSALWNLTQDNILLYTWKLTVVGGALNNRFVFRSNSLGATSWNASGKSGRVTVPIDISSITRNSDSSVRIMLEISTVPGPGSYVQVQGDLVRPPQLIVSASTSELIITNIKRMEAPDANEYIKDTRIKISDPRFSIPRPSQSNFFKREYQLSVSKPPTAVIENVKVDLKNAADEASLTTVYQSNSSSANTWTWDADNNVLTTTVTYQAPQKVAAGFSSTPPPAEKILYEFTVRARQGSKDMEDSKSTLSGAHNTKEVKTYSALWQIPDAYAPRSTKRFTLRDDGDDGWCSKQTYEWLELNGQLIPRIGDISGEHGRNIGHSGHLNGNDIDMFQFFEVNTTSGGANYLALAKKVAEAAINGDAAAKVVVKDAIAKMRTGLQNLLGNSKVDVVYTGNGSIQGKKPPARPTRIVINKVDNSTLTLDLPEFWLRELIESGKTKLIVNSPPPAGNQELTLELGFDTPNWAPANRSRIKWKADHWDHIHVTLKH